MPVSLYSRCGQLFSAANRPGVLCTGAAALRQHFAMSGDAVAALAELARRWAQIAGAPMRACVAIPEDCAHANGFVSTRRHGLRTAQEVHGEHSGAGLGTYVPCPPAA
jgi:hypothetical protein